jgi:hypothetical protein
MVSGTTNAVSLFFFSTKIRIDDVAAGSVNPPLFLSGFRVVVLAAAAFVLSGMILELPARAEGRRS